VPPAAGGSFCGAIGAFLNPILVVRDEPMTGVGVQRAGE